MKDLKLKPPDSEKLLLTIEDKNNYVVHSRNLQFYLKQGMNLKRIHRELELDQECWMGPYVRMNTEFRKDAKRDIEKNFHKLMNKPKSTKMAVSLLHRFSGLLQACLVFPSPK